MEVKASLKYLRISPRKVRLVANLIKGLTVEEAEAQLFYNSKRSSKDILKLLRSAVANAEHNFHLEKKNLYISSIRVNGGPTLKRWSPRARGSAYTIKKRSSHILLALKDLSEKNLKKTTKLKREKANSSKIRAGKVLKKGGKIKIDKNKN